MNYLPKALQCPHHGAKNSTRMSFSGSTIALKLSFVKVITSDSSADTTIEKAKSAPAAMEGNKFLISMFVSKKKWLKRRVRKALPN